MEFRAKLPFFVFKADFGKKKVYDNLGPFTAVFVSIKAVPLLRQTSRWLIRNAIIYSNQNIKGCIGNRPWYRGIFKQKQQLHLFAGGANLSIFGFCRFADFSL